MEERETDRPRVRGVSEVRGSKQRGGGERSPMVLPYGKSPAAMVNARIIGGRYARLLREAKK